MAEGPRRQDQAPTPKRPRKRRRDTKPGRGATPPPGGGATPPPTGASPPPATGASPPPATGAGATPPAPIGASPPPATGASTTPPPTGTGASPPATGAGGAMPDRPPAGGPPFRVAAASAASAATSPAAGAVGALAASSAGPPPIVPTTYAAAGVDIRAGEAAVDRIKRQVRSTFRPEVISDIGGFGSLFAFDTGRYREPVLVSSTDSVGTKALVARQAGRLGTIGIDLVAMVVDDIAAQGAEPLFFLDCISVGRLDPADIETLIGGIVTGCRQAGCSLVGGEMAEVPGMLEEGAFDLVGFGVGVVERARMVTGDDVEPGDRIIGLPSPGLRSNGYSLARRVLFDQAGLTLDSPAWPDARHTVADELLRPSVIYAPAIVELCRQVPVRALAHITGGGLPGNIPRVLPEGVDAVIRRGTWDVPEIFYQLRELGPVSTEEMTAVFNLGIGMVAVVAPDDVYDALGVLGARGLAPVVIGEIVPGARQVHFA